MRETEGYIVKLRTANGNEAPRGRPRRVAIQAPGFAETNDSVSLKDSQRASRGQPRFKNS